MRGSRVIAIIAIIAVLAAIGLAAALKYQQLSQRARFKREQQQRAR